MSILSHDITELQTPWNTTIKIFNQIHIDNTNRTIPRVYIERHDVTGCITKLESPFGMVTFNVIGEIHQVIIYGQEPSKIGALLLDKAATIITDEVSATITLLSLIDNAMDHDRSENLGTTKDLNKRTVSAICRDEVSVHSNFIYSKFNTLRTYRNEYSDGQVSMNVWEYEDRYSSDFKVPYKKLISYTQWVSKEGLLYPKPAQRTIYTETHQIKMYEQSARYGLK